MIFDNFVEEIKKKADSEEDWLEVMYHIRLYKLLDEQVWKCR